MIIEDSMVSLAKRYTKLEFHEKTKRYYGTCPFCHSGADMFCADNKNGVFWCYACGKHGNMDDFKILMGPFSFAVRSFRGLVKSLPC